MRHFSYKTGRDRRLSVMGGDGCCSFHIYDQVPSSPGHLRRSHVARCNDAPGRFPDLKSKIATPRASIFFFHFLCGPQRLYTGGTGTHSLTHRHLIVEYRIWENLYMSNLEHLVALTHGLALIREVLSKRYKRTSAGPRAGPGMDTSIKRFSRVLYTVCQRRTKSSR